MTASTKILLTLLAVFGAAFTLANLHTVSGTCPNFVRINNLTGYTEFCSQAYGCVTKTPEPKRAPVIEVPYSNTIPCSRKDAADLKAKGYDRLANDFLYNC